MMASPAEKEKKIVLRSSDGEVFQVEEATARQSNTISNMIDDGCAENTIPLFQVDAKTLAKVIEYCSKHAVFGKNSDANAEIKSWDAAYIDVHHTILYDILVAANFLDIQGLLDLGCDKAANMIKGKSVDEIRKTFDIENDFTPEEEEEIRKEHQWAID